MSDKKFYGQRADIKTHDPRYDHRSKLEKIHAKLKNGEGLTALATSLAAANLLLMCMPMGTIVSGVISQVCNSLYYNRFKQKFSAPYRMPQYLNIRDGSLEAIGVKKINAQNIGRVIGAGSTYLGYDLERKQQVWVSDDDLTVHAMILGTTKSGKTTAIEVLCANALMKGGGFINIDAKGDIVFQQHAQMLARYFGREDDYLTIAFTPYEGGSYGDKKKQTNTFNLFANASASSITEMLVSLMDGQEDVWKGRAVAFVGALIRPLVYLRDRKGEVLSPSKLVDYLDFTQLAGLCYSLAEEDLQLKRACGGLISYMESLPAFDKNKSDIARQGEETLKQHGFITMQLTRALNDLTYSYGHIFGVDVGEISMTDVVFNRRILTCLLPSLGRSISTLNMLGRLMTGSVKQMMALSLGSEMEGKVRLIVDARPTESRNIFLIIFDEVGFMMSEGMSVIPSQARSLKLSAIFSGQTYSNLEKGDKLEAEEIWDNTGIKLIGKIATDRTSSTFRKVEGLFDSRYYLVSTGVEKVGGAIKSKNSWEYRELQEAKLLDFGQQEQGQFTLVSTRKEDGGTKATSDPVRMQMLYPKWDSAPEELILNDFIPLNMEDYVPMPQNRVKNLIVDVGTNEEEVKFFQTLNRLKTTNTVNYFKYSIDRLTLLTNNLNSIYNNKAAIVNIGLVDALKGVEISPENISVDAKVDNAIDVKKNGKYTIKLTNTLMSNIKKQIKPLGFDRDFEQSDIVFGGRGVNGAMSDFIPTHVINSPTSPPVPGKV